MSDQLQAEFNYYLEHQDKLVERYRGRVIVIKGTEILGDYDTEFEAYQATSKTHKLGTFLIQKCEPGAGAYTATFHSRVAI